MGGFEPFDGRDPVSAASRWRKGGFESQEHRKPPFIQHRVGGSPRRAVTLLTFGNYLVSLRSAPNRHAEGRACFAGLWLPQNGEFGLPITSNDLARCNIKDGSYRHLVDLLREQYPRRIAFFRGERDREIYYAVSSSTAALPRSPLANLFLSGVHTLDDIGLVRRNYTPRTKADEGVVGLCSGIFYQDDRNKPSKDLAKLIEDNYKRVTFNQVTTTDMPALLRGDFPVYTGQPPNIDVRLETPSNPGAHDGFHTVHRLYMAAAYRMLRAIQNPGGRAGVAALIVDGTNGQILSWALKNPAHPVLHAEASAIIALGTSLPNGVRIYSTLKPCQMCAAIISMQSGGNHRVFYGQDDPGGSAQGTLLDADRSSRLLDGRRRVPGVRGIVPIYQDGDRARVTLAEMLDEEYRYQGGGSVIDFATSDPARVIYNRSDRMFEAKIDKYDTGNPDVRNRNVWAVLSYLTGFLNQIGVATPQLAPPG
jgi:tRNA(Arg) A34 adenosine deaminase TadA